MMTGARTVETLPQRIKRRAFSLLPVLRAAAPYSLLLFASFLPFLSYFQGEGIPTGHDIRWHLSYAGDLLYNFRHGNFALQTSSIFYGSLSYSVFSLYAPLAEYLYAGTAYAFGLPLTVSIKIVNILSVFLSGVLTYRLGLWVTDKNPCLSLAAGLLYVFFPYRLICFLCRAAYPEALALGAAPLLFLGLYRVLHDERNRFSSWLMTSFGVGLLLLFHPFTALVVILAGAFYALFSIDGLKRLFAQKSTAYYLPFAVFVAFGVSAFYLLPLLSQSRLSYYVYYDADRMGTSLASVLKNQTEIYFYSGFLNFGWLSEMRESFQVTDEASNWAMEIVSFAFAALFIPLIDFLAKKGKIGKGASFLWGLAPIVMAFVLSSRNEAYLASFLLLGCHVYASFFTQGEKAPVSRRAEVKKGYLSLLWSPEVYALIATIGVSFLFLLGKGIWRIAPAVFRNCQFPWRFYGVIGVSVCVLFLYLVAPLRFSPRLSKGVLFASCLGLLLVNAPVDKRIYLSNGEGLTGDYTAEEMGRMKKVGNNDEYLPRIFLDDSYESPYPSSLYPYVKGLITLRPSIWPSGAESYRVAFLTGEGDYEVTEVDTPAVSFKLTVREDALIQVAQFYYEGYRLVYSDETGKVSQTTPFYLEGLLAFELPEGVYEATLEYVGSVPYHVGEALLPISLGLSLYGLFVDVVAKEGEKRKKGLALNLSGRSV